VLVGLALVTVLLLIFLGDVRLSLLTALTIPFAILFAFAAMAFTGRSANLISIGAIDFGILAEAAVVVLENIYRRIHEASDEQSKLELIAEATAEAAKPVLFSTLVILVAFIPLFTMQGVPGRIFAPMSETYGFALTGALLFAVFFAPVLASYRRAFARTHAADTRLVHWLKHHYERLLIRFMARAGRSLGPLLCSSCWRWVPSPFLAASSCPSWKRGTFGFEQHYRKTFLSNIQLNWPMKCAASYVASLKLPRWYRKSAVPMTAPIRAHSTISNFS